MFFWAFFTLIQSDTIKSFRWEMNISRVCLFVSLAKRVTTSIAHVNKSLQTDQMTYIHHTAAFSQRDATNSFFHKQISLSLFTKAFHWTKAKQMNKQKCWESKMARNVVTKINSEMCVRDDDERGWKMSLIYNKNRI